MILLNFFSAWSLITALVISAPGLGNGRQAATATPPLKWTIEKSSMLRVSGKTNVNEFTCEIAGYYQPDTITCIAGEGNGKPVRLNGSLEMDVFRFDCHSRLITGDLRKTLKAKDHPKLVIRFLTLERVPDLNNGNQCLNGWVEVELAGVRRTFQIAYRFGKKGGDTYMLNGTKTFCFSDFKLVPPRKLAGIVQIKDEFVVDFHLKLNQVS